MTCVDGKAYAKWAEFIRRAVSEGLEASERKTLRAHVAACASCRTDFDRAADGVALLERRPFALPEAVAEGARADLFAALEAEGAVAAEVVEAHVLRFPAARRIWVGAGTVLALAAGVTAAVVLPGQRAAERPSGFTARGGTEAGLGFNVFCIRLEGGAPQVVSTTGADSSRPVACRLSDRIQFTYSARIGQSATPPETLSLFGVGPDGQVVWYWPRAGGQVHVEPGAQQAALPGSFELAARHAPGHWDIFGVFGPATIDTAAIEARVHAGSHAALGDLASDGQTAVLHATMDIADESHGGHAP